MASTYSSILRLELMATGDKSGSWGLTNNFNIGTLIEQAIAGVATVTHDDSAAYTLTTNNGAVDEARNAGLLIGGTLTANRQLIVPAKTKIYVAKNLTSGGFSVEVKTSGGTGITIPNGVSKVLVCDGTNVFDAVTGLQANGAILTSLDALSLVAGDVLYANGANSLTRLAKGTNGQYLTLSGGVPAWGTITIPQAVLPGTVAMFAANMPPTGWLECNGAEVSRSTYAALFTAIGTTWGAGDGSTTFLLPDLRGEFVRGWDNTRGIDSGRAFASVQTDQNKSHTHGFSATTSSNGAHTHQLSGHVVSGGGSGNYMAMNLSNNGGGVVNLNENTLSSGAHTHTVSGTTGSDGGTEVRVRNVALMFMIKT